MRAVVLLSGGMDSTTCLAIAQRDGCEVTALTVDYGQRHRVEISRAKAVARRFGVRDHRVIRVGLRGVGGSALTSKLAVPKNRELKQMAEAIPVTYVPARNTLFLALALGLAEVVDADAIYIGATAIDYSGYPDCRPEFLWAFQELARVATARGVQGHPTEIRAPLLSLSKAEIIRTGTALGVDYGDTLSCYDPRPNGAACGSCDACLLRKKGFTEASLPDPTRYATPKTNRNANRKGEHRWPAGKPRRATRARPRRKSTPRRKR